jgi:DNA-directed RNA polymerase alpha subunit
MDCVLCWKHAETHKASVPCHKCQEERIAELEQKFASLAEAGTGYSQETMNAVIQERAKLAQELLESHQAYHKLRAKNDEAQKTINYLRQQITVYAGTTPEEQHVSNLRLSVRGRKCMIRLGISTIDELIHKSADDLLQCKDFSQASLNEIRDKLAELNLKLRGE